MFVDGSEGNSIQLAPCCRPIPGDAIVGYLGRGEGLLVHTAECPTGKRLFERDSERSMAVEVTLPGGGPLTTAKQNFSTLGEHAGEALIARLAPESPSTYRHVLLDAPLSYGSSTAAYRTGPDPAFPKG